MSASVKNHVTSRAQWIRLLHMILFAFIYGVAELVIGAVVLIQLVTALVTGRANERLSRFGQQLSSFVYELLRFVTYASDHKPFPFHDWPRGEPGQPRAAGEPTPQTSPHAV